MYDLDEIKRLCEEGFSNEKIALITGKGSASSVARFLKKHNINKINRIKYLTGERFGKLLVKEYLSTHRYKDGGTYHVYNCECDCGNNFSVRSCNLKNGHSTRCSKCKSEHLHNKNSTGKIPSSIKLGAKYRSKYFGREYNITDEYLYNLFLSQNSRCYFTNVELHFTNTHMNRKYSTASLDRIDNSLGYIEGNVRWVHKKINLIKNDISDEDFIKMCELVVNNKKNILTN
jgi:hypothetical protein